ncbi:MAG: S8 family serine peptidase [Pseudomonadota bacterium]
MPADRKQQMPPSHDEAFALLPWYLNETLEPSEKSLVQGHLHECLVCSRELQRLQTLAEAIDLPDQQVLCSRAFARLITRIERQHTTSARSAARVNRIFSRRLRRRLPLVAAVVSLVVASVLVGKVFQAANEPFSNDQEQAVASAGEQRKDDIVVLLEVEGMVNSMMLADIVGHDHELSTISEWPLRSLQGHGVVYRTPPGQDRDRIIARLNADRRVASAQPLMVHRVAGRPRVPDAPADRSLRRATLEALQGNYRGRNVRLAVVDTGVDSAHPALRGQVDHAIDFVGEPGETMPAEYHGTAIIGIIAARDDDLADADGWAPDVELMALRGCWEQAGATHPNAAVCNTRSLAQALDFAVGAGADIVNLNWVGPEDPLVSRLLRKAIDSGALVFAVDDPLGQSSFPGSVDNVIVVAPENNVKPGADTRLALPDEGAITTVPGGRYDVVSGPSVLAAHAAATAALLVEYDPSVAAPDVPAWFRQLKMVADEPRAYLRTSPTSTKFLR